MKKRFFSVLLLVVVALTAVCLVLTACGDQGSQEETQTLRFSAPEGTPALAMLRLVTDNKTIGGKNMTYEVVSPSNIAVEMSAEKSDIVIMPINAGANHIRQGADYKLVSVAVDGSLFMVGKKETAGEITIDEIKGKTIACIGKAAVPGLVFRYVMNGNGIKMIEEGTPNAENSEVLVKYVADGNAARTLLVGGQADFAVVGEPAATAFKGALKLNAEMNMQTAYTALSGKETYPQAGLFVKKSLSDNEAFMKELFTALQASKEWAINNAASVTEYAKANLYESAVFPEPSIARCAIDVQVLTETKKTEIVTFLQTIMPKDSQGNAIDWTKVALF
ncbi:MAG: hypothetical protein IJ735_00075 [Clostridia bacterium]|nr:hypothetical protein [Clostridia bacterium]